MPTVESSVMQKTFGEQLDKLHEGPIQITRYGRPAGFLISPRLFSDLLASYRKALPVEALTPGQVELMLASGMEGDGYNLDDIPELAEAHESPVPSCQPDSPA